MSYRDDLTALQAQSDALRKEIEEKQRALASSEAILAEARARARLPVLDNLRVATPCPADWNQMSGDERVRFCGQCQKNVFNVSELSRDEAQALIVEHAGKLCVRYFQRQDGTILLADCEIGQKRKRKQRMVAGAAAVVFGASAGAAALVSRHNTRGQMLMGVMSPPPYAVESRPARPYQPKQHMEIPDVPRPVAGGISVPDPQEWSAQEERDALDETRAVLEREIGQAKRKLRAAQRAEKPHTRSGER